MAKIVSLFTILAISACALLAFFANAAKLQTHVSMTADLRLHPFTNFSTPDFAVIDGATISIEANFVPGYDKLFFDYQGAFNINEFWDADRGSLFLVGSAPISEYLDAIAQVVFYTTADDFQPRRITWTLGRTTFYNYLTRHFYRFVTIPAAWQEAVDACAASNFLGMQGYLATVTSFEEHSLISSKVNQTYWIGLTSNLQSDYTKSPTSQWAWGSGPEWNMSVWSGVSMYEGGVAASGPVEPAFTAWGRFQPVDPTNLDVNGGPFVAYVNSQYEAVGAWYNKGGNVQGYICEYGGMDNGTLDAAMDTWTGSVVLEYDCALYTSSTDCVNRASFGCAWTGSNCKQLGCGVHVTEKDCDTDYRCEWETDITVTLVGRCANTRCSNYATQDTCEADPSCSFNSLSQCLPATCDAQQSPSACGSIESCTWNNLACKFEQSLGCDTYDIVYAFDSSSVMDQPFLTFTGGWQGLTDQFLNSQFALTHTVAGTAVSTVESGQRVGFVRYGSKADTNPSSTGSNGQVSGDVNQVMSDLQYMQSTFSPASQRLLSPALDIASKMLTVNVNDMPARKKVLVVFAAGALDDQSTSASKVAALQAQGVIVLGAVLRPTQPATQDSKNAWASLTALSSSIKVLNLEMDEVATQTIYGLCSLNTTFGMAISSVNVGAQYMCSSNANQASCIKNPLCGWSWATETCINSHCLALSSSACLLDHTCSWQNNANACAESCPSLKTLSQCNTALTHCNWNNVTNTCESFRCLANPTEDGCIADPNVCVFNASADIQCKPPACAYPDQATCGNDWTCVWSDAGACRLNPCKLAMNRQDLCLMNAECKWDKNITGNNKCVMHACAIHASEQTCNSDFDCSWSVTVSPSACMPATCTGFNKDGASAQANCLKNSSTCYWNPPTGGNPARCERLTCGQMKTSCACSTMSQCVWRNDQCKESTYVQCPAIDVAFLVEGTPVMNDAFGRHPNGIIGIIESIRSWSRDAPMTTNTAATGFRMGIILYGAGTALTVPAGTANGNALTGDPAKWLNPGMALDSIITAAPGYALDAQSNVKIQSGLEYAEKMFDFNNTGNDGRTKMLVVLGHSPITDGGQIVNQYITKFESQGVQIFSNVIRRFSSITPGDTEAAEYMRPLASDPDSAHFLFTTIDDMRKTLLDQFCDPSTNTGKALQVSRDKTLPCNWLEGQRECNMQPTCIWNASALPTCPLAGQCPNLGCVSLPDALAKKFSCDQCEINRGALQCATGNKFSAAPGLCVPSLCMSKCQSDCALDTNCLWNGTTNRCERNWCSSYSTVNTCDNDDGCVWDDFTGTPGCRPSACWSYRSATSCAAQIASNPTRAQCIWNTKFTPAICDERRCDALSQSDCALLPSTCKYNAGATGRKCYHVQCDWTRSDECEVDAGCYWDPYKLTCNVRTDNCQVSDFSAWSPCTASCGIAIRYQYRRIVQFPSDKPGAQSCAVKVANFPAPDNVMVKKTSCDATTIPGWDMDCGVHCNAYSSNTAIDVNARLRNCMMDPSCQWQSGVCVYREAVQCEVLNQTQCGGNYTDMCSWNTMLQFCQPAVTQCQFGNANDCKSVSWQCAWRTGATARSDASGLGVDDITLFNPGQPPVFVFPTLASDAAAVQTTMVYGASVMIESAFQRGRDILDLSIPTSLTSKWLPAQGVLVISGAGTVADYYNAIKFVTFQTTSTSTAPRHITWALGVNTVYSAITGHRYTYMDAQGASFQNATAMCAKTVSYGQNGYLVTITTPEENAVVSTKLLGTGWLNADNAKSGVWQWIGGPENGEAFWQGGLMIEGGAPYPNMFANWNNQEEPRTGAIGQMHAYLNATGYWSARLSNFGSEAGYVCEFGGMATDSMPVYPVGGATVFGAGGCIPNTCMWHASAAMCTADPDCVYDGFSCLPGCNARATASECVASDRCFWDSSVLPPVCGTNPCSGLGSLLCRQNSQCKFDIVSGNCVLQTGCPALDTEAKCNSQFLCQWFADSTMTTGGSCGDKACSSFGDSGSCAANPLCEYVAGNCIPLLCKYPDAATCNKHPTTCKYVAANASASYPVYPNVASMRPFSDPTLPSATPAFDSVDGVTVRIVEGFQPGQDQLFIQSSSDLGSIFTAWNFDPVSGTLLATFAKTSQTSSKAAYNAIVRDLGFRTSSTRDVTRRISYTIGYKSFFSSKNQAFVKVFSTDKPIATYAAAQEFCASTMLFGTQGGALATPDNLDDNVALQAVKGQGWFGAEALSGSGKWVWDYNASTQVNFWNVKNGAGEAVVESQSPLVYRFAQWGSGQPLPPMTGVNQYGFADSTGKWTSVTDNSPNTGTGVVCAFALNNESISMNFYNFVSVSPEGCFPIPCKGLLEGPCKGTAECVWTVDPNTNIGSCAADQFCGNAVRPNDCNNRFLCFWDYTRGACRAYTDATCAPRPQTSTDPDVTICANGDGHCEWNPVIFTRQGTVGACAAVGCGVNPVQLSCEANPLCRWFQRSGSPVGMCIDQLCGYLDSSSCWADPKCIWNKTVDKCFKSVCVTTSNCAAEASCKNINGVCSWVRCSASTKISVPNDQSCLFDPSCLIVNSVCTQPQCSQYTAQTDCNSHSECFYFTSLTGDTPSYCGAAQCTNNPDSTSCGGTAASDPCRWDASTGSCRQASAAEMTSSGTAQCVNEIEPNMWWLWFLLIIILAILGLIIWRLYLAYAKGLSFLDPPRKNIKFDAARQFASELFEEAQNTGDETNYEQANNNGYHSPANEEANNDQATLEDL